jgi:RNA polymerase sigma factor (sigma-70 family)
MSVQQIEKLDGGSDAEDLGELVRRAASGDRCSWDALVALYGPMVWSIARRICRSSSEAADVSQTVWLRFVEHADSIKQPERVAAWLATTTRRECLRIVQRASRLVLVDDERDFDVENVSKVSEAGLLATERDAVLWEAFGRLSTTAQTLLTLLMIDPPMSYQDISDVLDMPIGSIGPTRARILAALRRDISRRGVTVADALA